MALAATIIDWVIRLFVLVIVVDVVLSYFVDPYRPVRWQLDRLLAPLLRPIRRVMPNTGGIDFSPMALMIGLLILNSLIQSLLR